MGESICTSQENCCASLEVYYEMYDDCDFEDKSMKQFDDMYACEYYACRIENPTSCMSWSYNLLVDCSYEQDECGDYAACCETAEVYMDMEECSVSGRKEDYACDMIGCYGSNNDDEYDAEACMAAQVALDDNCGSGIVGACVSQAACCESLELYLEMYGCVEGKKDIGIEIDIYACDIYECHIDEPSTCASWGLNLMIDCSYEQDECGSSTECCTTMNGMVDDDCDSKKEDGEYACDPESCEDSAASMFVLVPVALVMLVGMN
jgi:hypothetical protein